MREVLGRGEACRQARLRHRRWRQRREETRQGAEGDEEGDGGDGAQDSERMVTQHILRLPE